MQDILAKVRLHYQAVNVHYHEIKEPKVPVRSNHIVKSSSKYPRPYESGFFSPDIPGLKVSGAMTEVARPVEYGVTRLASRGLNIPVEQVHGELYFNGQPVNYFGPHERPSISMYFYTLYNCTQLYVKYECWNAW